jgi:hypothetical protein
MPRCGDCSREAMEARLRCDWLGITEIPRVSSPKRTDHKLIE